MRRYEKMTKVELLAELAERGISYFDEEDASSILIEALYQDDEYAQEFPEAKPFSLRKSEW